jgi:nucleoside-diphosphate-sugar epimerase
VARVLVVGCGCRGRELAAALARDGHAVRGTTRQPARLAEIEAAGAEAAPADPARLATLLPHIDGVAAIAWLMGSAVGEPELLAALHGTRLRSLLEHVVDTPVRGFVYEAAGSVDDRYIRDGRMIVREAADRWQIPVEVVPRDPREHAAWVEAMRGAITRLLAGG